MAAIRRYSLVAYGQRILWPGFAIGETVEYTIACQDPNTRAPMDLTGANVIMTISALDPRQFPKSPPKISRQGDILFPDTDGMVAISFATSDTVPAGVPFAPCTVGVDLWLTDSAGNRLQSLAFGLMELTPSAGLPDTPITPLPSQIPLAQGPQGPPGVGLNVQEGVITIVAENAGTTYTVEFDVPFGDAIYFVDLDVSLSGGTPPAWAFALDRTFEGFDIILADDQWIGDLRWRASKLS